MKLVCLDDDNAGRRLDVPWELEFGAKAHRPEAHRLGEVDRIDPPRHFAAYLHALKWHSVTQIFLTGSRLSGIGGLLRGGRVRGGARRRHPRCGQRRGQQVHVT